MTTPEIHPASMVWLQSNGTFPTREGEYSSAYEIKQFLLCSSGMQHPGLTVNDMTLAEGDAYDFSDGVLVQHGAISISPFAHGIAYAGTGFEGIRARRIEGQEYPIITFGKDHVVRLAETAKHTGNTQLPDTAVLEQGIRLAVAATPEGWKSMYVRPQIARIDPKVKLAFGGVESILAVGVTELKSYLDPSALQEGVTAVITPFGPTEMRGVSPQAKAGPNYLPRSLADDWANAYGKEHGHESLVPLMTKLAKNPLYAHSYDEVWDGSGGNILFINEADKKVIIPPRAQIFSGITLKKVLEQFEARGFMIEEHVLHAETKDNHPVVCRESFGEFSDLGYGAMMTGTAFTVPMLKQVINPVTGQTYDFPISPTALDVQQAILDRVQTYNPKEDLRVTESDHGASIDAWNRVRRVAHVR